MFIYERFENVMKCKQNYQKIYDDLLNVLTYSKNFLIIFLLIAEFKVPDLAVWNPTRLFWGGQIPGAKKRKIHGEFLWIPFAIPRPPKWLYLFPKVFNVVQILGTRLKVRAIYKKKLLSPVSGSISSICFPSDTIVCYAFKK